MRARRLAAATLLVVAGCSDIAASRSEGDGIMVAKKEQAVQRAMQAVRDMPRDLSRYDIETTETDGEWEIQFTGKPPRPPGDEVTVYINKHTGALRVMQGE